MTRGIIAIFALIMLASCGNNTTKKEDKCCTTTEKSETSCCSSDVKTTTTCGSECGSCGASCSDKNTASTAGTVEVMYMHGKQRCVTCIAIGTEAEAVVKEFANDKVVIRTVDFSTPEGEKIADKYEIASSSLIVVKDGKVDNLTAAGFQYARNNPELFRNNLKESIQNMLD